VKTFNKKELTEAKESFLKQYSEPVKWAAVMGSGLSGVFDDFKIVKRIPFSSIAHMPVSGVQGHPGEFVVAEHNGNTVLAQLGRVHLYEGYSAYEVSFSIGLFGELGIKNVLLTNAAGGIADALNVGELMVIEDHINLQAGSPLTTVQGSEKFLDMSETYAPELVSELSHRFRLARGVYAAVRGPHFETPAEIRYLRTIGTDAIGMSTVMEAIMARFYGLRIAGVSLITNKGAGLIKQVLDHSDVMEAAKIGKDNMTKVIKFLITI